RLQVVSNESRGKSLRGWLEAHAARPFLRPLAPAHRKRSAGRDHRPCRPRPLELSEEQSATSYAPTEHLQQEPPAEAEHVQVQGCILMPQDRALSRSDCPQQKTDLSRLFR